MSDASQKTAGPVRTALTIILLPVVLAAVACAILDAILAGIYHFVTFSADCQIPLDEQVVPTSQIPQCQPSWLRGELITTDVIIGGLGALFLLVLVAGALLGGRPARSARSSLKR
jgi:hypothetical protein